MSHLPVLLHSAVKVGGVYGPADDRGLPRLEKVLSKLPDTIFIVYAMGSGQRSPHLYGDLSAGSEFNAISRDPEYGYKFLEEFQDKLLFGTDICHVNQDVPIVPYLKNALRGGKNFSDSF